MQYILLILIYKISIDKWICFRNILVLFYSLGTVTLMTYQKDIVSYQNVELEAHVNNRSSIVNKATQETLEMKQWMKNDLQNVLEEARDAIVNILSATYHAWVMVDELIR